MARRTLNPYLDPSWAQVGSNLVKAFAGDGGKGAYYAANTRKTNLEADALDRKNKGAVSVSELFRSNPQGVSQAVTSQLYASALDAGIMPDQVNKLALGLASNFGAPDGAVARALVGTGKTIGENEGVSIGDREAVAARADKARKSRTDSSAGIAAGAHIKGVQIQEAGRDRRYAPTVAEGHAVFPTPNNPAFQGVAPGSIPAPRAPTPNTVAGAILDKVATGEQDPATLTPGQQYAVNPPTAKPAHVGPKEIGDIESGVLAEIGAWDNDARAASAKFVELHAPKLDAARQAAAATLQKTRDSVLAAKAYRDALGIRPGDRFEPAGGPAWAPWGGPSGPPRMERGGSPVATAIQPPAGASPAAPPPAPGPGAPRPGADAAPPVERLKDGVETRFANGQVWTLRNGQAVRVR